MKTMKPFEKSLFKTINIRCYAELNAFLPEERKQKNFLLSIKMPLTVGEVIEFLGIPLSEVDLVLVNSKPVLKSQRLYEHDYVSVFPTFETFDISCLKATHKKPLRITSFILDAHLGKLAKYLRMLGFDTLYRNDYGDEEIINIAYQQKRIILSRDKLLLKSNKISHGYYVRAIEKHAQLIEVVRKFDLYSQFNSFSRCMTCNETLLPKNKNDLINKLKPEILDIYNEYYYCQSCDKVFWKGSHFMRMERLILDILENK